MNKDNNSAVRTAPSETADDVRLLVLDIDGTICDESNHICDSVAQATHAAQRRGVAVAIATGRMFQSSLYVYGSVGSTLPLICYEGAIIREPDTGFVHRHWPLESRVAAQLLDHTERLNLSARLSVHFFIDDNVYVSNLNRASIMYFEGSQVEPIVVSDLRQLLHRATTKVLVLSDDVEDIARLSTQLKTSHTRTQVKQYRSITFLEAFHPAVNKRLAVSYLAEEIMALRPENVMAVGDDFTDIEMLQYAGIGVAMGNASAEVKESADWVTTTIEEDGVAKAVEKWILPARSNPALTPACGFRLRSAM
ncbi:MAG TPA: Cof-type HAD-IIB family hydrolase [Pyrinomonadaceae bacterium]|nr:Cof-type HAD-IIB family hydrolase [Pyrinomonadaceae bacterium]